MNLLRATKLNVRVLVWLGLILLPPMAMQGQDLSVTTSDYPTLGNPTSAVATSDGRYVFVSVTNVAHSNFAGSDQAAGARTDTISGIQIFRRTGPLRSRNLSLKSAGFVETGTTGANGLVLLKDEKTLAVGAGDAGVAFLSVRDLVSGTAKPYFASEGEAAGTFDVVASADGKYVFAANEYGKLQGQRGSVGIIAVNADAQGNVNHPQSIAQIAVGDVVPSLMLSPDGSRLYVATELIPANQPPSIAGAGDPNLTKADCVQTKGTPAQHNGFVTVIDTQRAIKQDPTAVLSRVAAGCSPVRLVEAADSSVLFVSARGDDKILAFAPRSLDKAPEHALLRVFPSGGSAPVGIRLFHQDKLLAVANSNRFADSDGTFAILDVSNVSKSSSVAPPKTWPAGGFPRNIGIGQNGATLFLTNYRSRSLQVIQTAMH